MPGRTLRLSLDLPLQLHLMRSLSAALRSGSAPADLGSAVVMSPRSGQVLAMASAPSYNSNVFTPPVRDAALSRLFRRPGHPMLEHATQAVAPPGSTFKLVVAAADAVHPVVSPHEIVPTGGSWTLDGHTFHNWSALPPQDLPQAIAMSNDVYFYKLAWALGPGVIARVAHQLGVGRRTGIDLPGEYPGFLGTPRSEGRQWYPGSTVLMGIGQGYTSVTPLQDAVWTSAVATGSVVVPHFAMTYGRRHHGTALKWPAPRRLPFAAKLGPVRDGMRQVVTNGTALALRDLPVPAGGKTGTAEDPTAPGAGTDSWMSAVAPLRLHGHHRAPVGRGDRLRARRRRARHRHPDRVRRVEVLLRAPAPGRYAPPPGRCAPAPGRGALARLHELAVEGLQHVAAGEGGGRSFGDAGQRPLRPGAPGTRSCPRAACRSRAATNRRRR